MLESQKNYNNFLHCRKLTKQWELQLGAVHILRQPKSGVPGPPLHSGPGCGHINLVKVEKKCGEMRIKLSDHCYP